MIKRFHAALAALILLASSPALADYQVKDATGATITIKSRDVGGGVQAPQFDGVINSTAADRGGTIAAGGTAQPLMAANTARRGFLIQNQSTGDLYINGLTAAAANQTSLRIPAGALYESSPQHTGTGAVSIFGATTGQAFYAREF